MTMTTTPTPIPKLTPAQAGGPFTDAWRTLHATREMFLATLRDLRTWDEDRAREAADYVVTELRELRLID
jgi:hypothetical protein